MTKTKISISTINYFTPQNIRKLNACLSKWLKNPKTLNFVNPKMRYPFKIEKWIKLHYTNKNTKTFILKEDEWIIGHLSFLIIKEEESAHIFHLIIDSEKRKKGYAKKLISHAEKIIKKDNIKKITLNVLRKNEIAIKLYTSLGYKVVDKKSDRLIIFKKTI